MTDLPRRTFARSARLASIPLGMAGRAAVGLGRRATGEPAAEVNADLQARTALQLFEVLGSLKGGAMKFGQAMSMFESAVPEHLAAPYRESLTKLQEAAPAMPAAQVHQSLEQEWGPQWRSRFTSFEDTPAAAASIGQVHRAVWADGRKVAVKIQYPGAAQALSSDLAQVARVAKVSAGWIPGLELNPILEELQGRMSEELDYLLEAEAQGQVAQAFADDPEVLVPEVIEGTRRVLVSTWIEGRPMSQVIAEGTPAERDHAARRYAEFVLAAPQQAGLLHADPHPGNFRIMPDGRLGVLDFGAVNRLPDGLPPALGRLLALAVAADAEGLVELLRDEGFIRSSVSVDAQSLLDYLNPFLDPLRSTEFTFTREWLRGIFSYVNDPRSEQFGIGLRLNLPPQYLLIHRAWLGAVAVMCQIGGTVPVRALVAEHVPGASG